jgi:hypothetical protein
VSETPIGWRNRAKLEAYADKPTADTRLIMAYQNIFAKGGEDVELILADLAAFCGFYQVEQGGVTADDLNHHAGRRAVFGRIFSFLALSDSQLAALEQASRDEAASTGE